MDRGNLLTTVAAFEGNVVYALPWSPAFSPNEVLMYQCPGLPYIFWNQVREIAGALGRVLHVPRSGVKEGRSEGLPVCYGGTEEMMYLTILSSIGQGLKWMWKLIGTFC